MVVKKRLGIFGIDAHASSNITSTFGDGCMQWLFGDVPGSIVRYMSEASAELIDISDVELFGFNAVTDAGLVTKLSKLSKLGRGVAAQTAGAIALGMCPGLHRFDGLIFIVRGVLVDAGATQVSLDGRTYQCAIFDDAGPHCFIAHEVGHVVGMDHSFKLTYTDNRNHYLYGEYGDATDLMSAMTYGDRKCTFVMPVAAGSDIAPAAPFWSMCGPGISPATLWRYLSNYPQIPPWAVELNPQAPAVPVTLAAAGHSGTTMAVLPWPGYGGGWWTVEYRPARGWDQGLLLEDGDHANAPGVVIHIIRDIGTGLEDPSYPRRGRVTYEATIPVPGAGDNDWNGGGFGIRVVNATKASASLLIGQLPGQRRALLRLDKTDGTPTSTPNGTQAWVPLAGPNCAGGFYPVDRTTTPVEVTIALDTWGFEYPIFVVNINGHALPEGTTSTSQGPDSFTIDTDVAVPTGWQTASTQHRSITIGWRRAANRYTLQIPPGDGTWTLNASVSVREGGITQPFATDAQTIDVTTASIDLSRAAIDDLERCLRKLIARVGALNLTPLGMPKPPGPTDGPDWSWLRGADLVTALAHLRDLERRFPKSARELRGSVAQGLGMAPLQVRWLEGKLPD